MRIAAGILMIIGAFLGITVLRAAYGTIPGLLGWLPWLWAFFVGFGGLYTLKRKEWRLCLTSSILLLPAGIIPPFFVGILPIIFVCLRKREWESRQGR